MSALALLEQQFLAHLRGGESFPRASCKQARVDSDIGLAIYTNAYRARLRESLETDHPILSWYLGDELWESFCLGYIDAHPSRYRSLRHFGESAVKYLGEHAPFSEHPLIAELAAFERLLLDVFDAADAERIDWTVIEQLAPSEWPGMRLCFHPSVRVLATHWNAVEVWQASKAGLDPPSAASSVSPGRLLWRDDARISRFRPLAADEFVAIEAILMSGCTFAGLCEALACIGPAESVPAIAVGFLRCWVDEGLVSSITL